MEIDQTFRAVCFRNISFDLNITAAIHIVTKKPASIPQGQHHTKVQIQQYRQFQINKYK